MSTEPVGHWTVYSKEVCLGIQTFEDMIADHFADAVLVEDWRAQYKYWKEAGKRFRFDAASAEKCAGQFARGVLTCRSGQ